MTQRALIIRSAVFVGSLLCGAAAPKKDLSAKLTVTVKKPKGERERDGASPPPVAETGEAEVQ